MIKIALDAMGGDNAPHDVVHGGIEAARSAKDKYTVVLVGEKSIVEKEIARHFHTQNLPIEIVHAPDVVAMDDQPSMALRKKESSIAVGIKLLKEGAVDAFVSAGNTGAVMASALFGLKRIPGIRRPAIGSILPSEKGPTLVMDVGANVDCRPLDLLQFGVMGEIYYTHIFSPPETTVGLLSVGHEKSKGNEAVIKAHELFANSTLNFIGNVEGGDILHGTAHVVVCDGFVGNIILKVAESLHGLFKFNLKRLIRKYFFSQIGAILMKPTFEGIRQIFDYQEYGGAPLLGVDGCCIIAHGKSTPHAIKNAILAANKMVVGNINYHIKEKMASLSVNEPSAELS